MENTPQRALLVVSVPMFGRFSIGNGGIVRLIRFGVCGLMRWRFSGGELMPFSERRRSVLLEDIAAVEVAVLIEVIMDRGVNRGKLL